MLGETLEEGLSKRLCERLVENFGEMLDAYVFQVSLRQGSSRIQES